MKIMLCPGLFSFALCSWQQGASFQNKLDEQPELCHARQNADAPEKTALARRDTRADKDLGDDVFIIPCCRYSPSEILIQEVCQLNLRTPGDIVLIDQGIACVRQILAWLKQRQW